MREPDIVSFPASDDASSSLLVSSIILPLRLLALDAMPDFMMISPDVPDATAVCGEFHIPRLGGARSGAQRDAEAPSSLLLLDTTSPLAPVEDVPPCNARRPPSICPEPAETDILPPVEDTLFPASIITILPSQRRCRTTRFLRRGEDIASSTPPLPACKDIRPPDPFPLPLPLALRLPLPD